MKQSARRTIHLLLMLSLAVSIFVLTPGRALAGSVITVTLTGDRFGSGAGCSLREAIFAANHDTPVAGCASGSGADTIVLAAGNYSLSLQGAEEDDDKTGDLDILAGLTIRGAGADQTVIAADQTFGDRIFDVNPTGSSPMIQVLIQDLKITGGASSSINGGGGIRNQAELTLQNMEISGNKVTSATASSSGGGIKNAFNATLNIDHSTIADNTADYGGGIYNLGSLNINISQIASNTANFSGGGLKNDLGTALIDGSSITSNESKSFDHAGAGIGNSSRLVVSNSSIQANIGQGISNDSSQPLLITGSTVSNNIGLGIRHTGGALSIYNTQVVANSSDGIINLGNSLTLTDTSVSHNKGVGVRNEGSMSIDFTAILYNDGVGLVNTSNHKVDVTNSTIAKNALVNLSDPSGIDNAGTLTLQNNTIVDNGGYGLKVDGGSATVIGTIIARHPGEADCVINNGAIFTSGGFNVVQNPGPDGSTRCSLISGDDLIADPLLETDPGDHGGRTQTYAFTSIESKAINFIPAGNKNCLPVDQRHFRRSDNGSGCDAGAFEDAAQFFRFMYYAPVIGRH